MGVRKAEASCYQSTSLVPSMDKVLSNLEPIFKEFVMYVPAVGVTPPPLEDQFCISAEQRRFPGDFLQSRFAVQAPDTRLIQYDCGKLQILANLLRTLQAGGHRVLIFTQMTKMLDVLEAFLNYHGYVYMRLDGSTRVEMRQCLMERFNNDTKYFAFILSTRSGGVGINLTGADTVIFYDSDWNPTMDAQAQDRCHRIGQTRDVHIYRLVSERTVEENILKKANQKDFLETLPLREATLPRPSSKSPPLTIYLTTRQPTPLWMMMKSQWKRLVQPPRNPSAPLKMLLPLPKMPPTFWRQRRRGRKKMLMRMTSGTRKTSSMLCWQN